MSEINFVWVLWWKYSDGSGMGVERVYSSESRAKADLALLTEHSNVTWEITQIRITH